jgi:membrane-associated phospholipid phosphatase
VARVVTEIFAPWVFCAVVPYAVAFSSATPWWALLWGTLVAIGAAGIPMAVITHGNRTGRMRSGRHVTTRAERHVPLVAAILSVVAVFVVLLLAGAPSTMVGVTVAMLVTVAIAAVITRVWKVSLHAGVSAGSAMVLTLIWGTPALPVWAACVLVGWSRVKLRDHTVAQVLVGGGLGATGGLLFALFS